LVTQKSYNDWGVKEGEPHINLMNNEQILEMINYGIEIGGHTRNHNALNIIPFENCENEILGCKEDIENAYQSKVLSFAYPFGGLTEDIKSLTKGVGYVYAVSTNTGSDNLFEDLMEIKRIEISPRTSLRSFKKKVSGTYFKRNLLQKIF
jgi:peptidoglycan/xylan/chitin deacetylase (PgdA/CDA1 family)